MEKCPGNANPLFLAAGQRIAQLSDFGIVALWERQNEIMNRRFFAASMISSLDAPGLAMAILFAIES